MVWGSARGAQVAPHTVVEAPMSERVRYLMAGYEHFTSTHVDLLKEKLRKLRAKRGQVRAAARARARLTSRSRGKSRRREEVLRKASAYGPATD